VPNTIIENTKITPLKGPLFPGTEITPGNTGSLFRSTEIELLNFEDLNITKKFKETPALHFIAFNLIINGFGSPIAVYENSDKKYNLLQDDKRVYSVYLILKRATLNYFINSEKYKIPSLIKEQFKTIPVLIYPKPNNEREMLLLQIAEGFHKSNNNLIVSEYLYRLIEEFGLKQVELAKMLGKSKQLINDFISIKAIYPDVKTLLEQIQLLGFTEKKLEKYGLSYFNNKNIGIKKLRKIADAANQAKEFWFHFGDKCSYEDAEFIGLTREEAEEIEKQREDNYFIPLLEEYIKILKKLKKSDSDSKDKLERKKINLAEELMPEFIRENNFDEKYVLHLIKQEVDR
jgi:hypothetical protein